MFSHANRRAKTQCRKLGANFLHWKKSYRISNALRTIIKHMEKNRENKNIIQHSTHKLSLLVKCPQWRAKTNQSLIHVVDKTENRKFKVVKI